MPFVPGLLQAAAEAPSGWVQVAPLLIIAGVGYFLLVRPLHKQRKEQEAMRSSLKPGDEILTTGGLYGTVTKLRDDRVHVRVADGVQVEVARAAVSSVVPPKE